MQGLQSWQGNLFGRTLCPEIMGRGLRVNLGLAVLGGAGRTVWCAASVGSRNVRCFRLLVGRVG